MYLQHRGCRRALRRKRRHQSRYYCWRADREERGSSEVVESMALLSFFFEVPLFFPTSLLPLSVRPVQMRVKKTTCTEWSNWSSVQSSVRTFLITGTEEVLSPPVNVFLSPERSTVTADNNTWAQLLGWGQGLYHWSCRNCWQLYYFFDDSDLSQQFLFISSQWCLPVNMDLVNWSALLLKRWNCRMNSCTVF